MKKTKWKAHIEACEKSGNNKRAYAEEHDLVYSQLLYWTRKLEEEPSTEFVPVKIKPEEKSMPKPNTPKTLGVLEFPNGARLVIHSPELLSLLPSSFYR